MNNYGGYQDRGNNSNMNSNNTMFQSSNFRNSQNGPNMNQNNNNFNLQNSYGNISLAQSQTLPINRNMKKLQVQMTKEEQMFYSKLYNMLDNNGAGRIPGKPAANFMKTSNLRKEVLKEIWLIAAQTSNAYILREEFYVAMRLIALAQNNMPFTAQSIEMNNPIPPLPCFDLNNNQNNSNQNQNNINQNNNIQNNNIQNNNNQNQNNNKDIYEISEKEKVFFKNIFDCKKEPNIERITAHNSIIIWKSNNAEDEAIKRVASIIKPLENKGFFNFKEFLVACHLIALSKKMQLPQQLPDTLVNFLGRNNNNNFNANNFNANNNNNNDFNNSRMNTISSISQNFTTNSNLNDSNFTIPTKRLSNSPFGNNNNNLNNNDNGDNRVQEILKKEEELTKKSAILNNQINEAKNKINDLLKEIELIQKRQDNINSELNSLRQECSKLKNNGNPYNVNNANIINFASKNDNNITSKDDNSLIKKNLENIGKNMRYEASDLNSNNELNMNNNINNNINNNNNNFSPPPMNKKDGYPNLDSKKPDLMDLMNKMDLNINNNNDNFNQNNINNGNNNINNNNFNNGTNNFNKNENNNVQEQHENRQDNQNNKDFDLDLEVGENLKITEPELSNPYEAGNDNKNENKNEDNGSNQKNGDDEWDF